METTIPDFQSLFESAPGLYLVLTPGLHIVAVSDAYMQATMVRRENILGRALFEVFPDNPDDPSATGTRQLRLSLERVMKNKSRDAMAIQKYDIRRPESEGGGFEERHWSPLNIPVLDPVGGVRYIIHKVEDVTEFVRLKLKGIEQTRQTEVLKSENDRLEQLRQAQRMEAMGQLAGGVAHDFNNVLATIAITCEGALEEPELTEALRDRLKLILGCSERAGALTRQLLAFSRKQVLQPKVLNLNLVVQEMHSLVSRLLPDGIDLKTDLDADLGNTLIDVAQVEQIVLNLVVNARDALPDGGRIVIKTANVELDEVMAEGNLSVPPGRYVKLSVYDNGIGMDAKTQARVFEPFFTTKPVGKGTGLGLATVYGIVKQNHGTVWVYSELKKGTTFKIYFPLSEQPVTMTESSNPTPVNLRAIGKTTILVVEDERALRLAIAKTLKDNGYTVFEVSNGAKGLAFLLQNKGTVDLVISDVIMPEMGGPAMAAKLKEHGHKVKILFLPGYTDDVLDSQRLPDSNLQFLEKPFGMRTLLGKVKAVLA